MSSFTDPVILKVLKQREFEVYEDFEFHVGCYPSERIITVKRGTKTDIATIPRLFWIFFPPIGNYTKAAIVHDYLYRTPSERVTRKEADEIFLEALVVSGVSPIVRYGMFYAVRLCGKRFFRKRTF